MADHPLLTAATAESGLVQDTLLDAFMKRMPLTIGPTEDLVDIVQSVGSVPLAILSATTGSVFFYDETDTTTADDGITCLVDGNGRRYKVQESAVVSVSTVLAISDTPPVSPSIGDSYVVDVAPTGAWSAQAKNIAIWTVRGWVFAVPEVGCTLLNQDTSTNIQYSAAGSWGSFVADIGAGSIAPTALQFPAGIVVEDTLNAPPGAPTTGKFWIVGSVPTGAFVGHAADLAYWTGSAWAFMDPADGWSAYHKVNGFEVYYVSGSWLGAAGSEVQTFSTAGAATWTKPARGSLAIIEVWGGGGSGGRTGVAGTRGGGGGGGGAYQVRRMLLSDLASSVSVTVGAGGASRTSGTTAGADGGTSSFGSHLSAVGGGGGSSNITGGGGSGGGIITTGVNAGTSATGAAAPDSTAGAGGNGASGSPTAGALGTRGGGGGGGGNGGAGNGGAGGLSVDGGGGGGGSAGAGTGGAGGISLAGGAGGAGADVSGNAVAGVQPAGGGGGASVGNSGKGGDGRVRVTVV